MKKTTKRKNQDNFISVWIVDDNRHFCYILSESLNISKTVRCEKYFCTCKSAISALESAVDPPSVILLDIKMPKFSGIDAIVPFKKVSPGTNILMITSFDNEDFLKTAIQRGANGYLLKTSSPEDIVRAIENIQDGGSPIDSHITKRMLDVYAGVKKRDNSYNLTAKERQIIKLCAEGKTLDEIAKELFISYHTVNTHRKNIFQKLNINSLQKLMIKTFQENLTD